MVFYGAYGQTDVESEIISDLIEAEFGSVHEQSDPNENDKNSIIVISETFIQTIDTSNISLMKFLKSGLTNLDSIMINDFIKKNQSSVNVPKFKIDQIKTIFMDRQKWDAKLKEGGWAGYHDTYGYIPTINVSRPGMNKIKKKAFIYYDVKSDKLGGAGFYLILENAADKWTIKEKIIAWRS
jgi:hypothetical protein